MRADKMIPTCLTSNISIRLCLSKTPYPDTTLVVRNVQSLANCQNQPRHGTSGNCHLRPTMRRVSVLAGERDSSQGGCSIASIVQGQKITSSSLLNNSCVADITQPVTSTPSATLQQSLSTPTVNPGSGSPSTPAPGGTLQTDSMDRVVSWPASSITSTSTSFCKLENLATPIPYPEACANIINPLRTRATANNQRQW